MSDKREATFHPEGQITPLPAQESTETASGHVSGPTPQPDATDAGEALVQQIAEALCRCGIPHETVSARTAGHWMDVRAVLPLVEAQVAPLRDEVAHWRGEMEDHNALCSSAEDDRYDAEARADAAESALRQVRELADDMHERGKPGDNDSPMDAQSRRQIREDVKRIRAILDSARVGAADTQPEGAAPSYDELREAGWKTPADLDAAREEGRAEVRAQVAALRDEWAPMVDGRSGSYLNPRIVTQRLDAIATPTAGGKVDTEPDPELFTEDGHLRGNAALVIADRYAERQRSKVDTAPEADPKTADVLIAALHRLVDEWKELSGLPTPLTFAALEVASPVQKTLWEAAFDLDALLAERTPLSYEDEARAYRLREAALQERLHRPALVVSPAADTAPEADDGYDDGLCECGRYGAHLIGCPADTAPESGEGR